MNIKIYSGLSLNYAEIQEHLPDAILCSPVKRGDISTDIRSGVNVIGIVDGEFFQNFAITPTEVLDALRVGIRVYGSSSMGALRAAELSDFGMVGCGKVFKMICDRHYFADDYLGVVFNDLDNTTGSMPFVDFVFTLEFMVESEFISKEVSDSLKKSYDELHFTQRNFEHLFSKILQNQKLEFDAAEIMKNLRRYIVNQKKLDGITMLNQIAKDLEKIKSRNSLLNY